MCPRQTGNMRSKLLARSVVKHPSSPTPSPGWMATLTDEEANLLHANNEERPITLDRCQWKQLIWTLFSVLFVMYTLCKIRTNGHRFSLWKIFPIFLNWLTHPFGTQCAIQQNNLTARTGFEVLSSSACWHFTHDLETLHYVSEHHRAISCFMALKPYFIVSQ